jgi:hypothetical protein
MENPDMTFEIENLIRQTAGLPSLSFEQFESDLAAAE